MNTSFIREPVFLALFLFTSTIFHTYLIQINFNMIRLGQRKELSMKTRIIFHFFVMLFAFCAGFVFLTNALNIGTCLCEEPCGEIYIGEEDVLL